MLNNSSQPLFYFDEEIKDNKLLLILPNGEKKANISLSEAIKIAKGLKMNVVLVVPGKDNNLAVARVVDKGKFLFEYKKKMKEKNKSSSSNKSKELTIRTQVQDNDLKRFANNVTEWIKDKNYVSMKINGKDDLMNISRNAIKDIPKKLKLNDPVQYNKERNRILSTFESQLENMAKATYDKFLSYLDLSIIKISSPFKKTNNTTFTASFSPIN